MTTEVGTQLFVDASGWVAYLSREDPNHQKAVNVIRQSRGAIVTSDKELLKLSYVDYRQVEEALLSKLIWALWDNQLGKVIRVTEDEELDAWSIYELEDESSLTECSSLILLNKHHILNLLSFSSWLRNRLSHLHLI
jgi:predicted nucleic acid-binding protein